MFKWFKQHNNVDTKQRSLNNDVIQQQIYPLQTLTGVTKNDFYILYVNTLERFAAYLAEPNQTIDETAFNNILKNVIIALKKRQGYVLPLGADSETSFREREEWTFAIFTAALFKTMDVTTRFAVAKALLPTQGFAWLHRNTTLFTLWQRYLQGDVQQNILADIIDDGIICVTPVIAEHDEQLSPDCIEQPDDVEKGKQGDELNKSISSIHHDNDDSEELDKTQITTSDQPQKHKYPNNTVIQEVDLATLSTEDTQAPPWQENDVSQELRSDSTIEWPTFHADNFWQWLKEAVRNQHMTINQPDSVVHGVDLGLLICIPQAVDAFFIEQAKRYDTNANSIALSQRIALTKGIKKHDALIRNEQGSRIHAYCVGQWENRQVLSGVVSKPEAIVKDEITLPINPSLTPDPMGDL